MLTMMRALAMTGGEWVIYILLFFSIVAVAVILERLLVLRRQAVAAAAARKIFLDSVDQKAIVWDKVALDLEQSGGFVALTLADTLKQSQHGADSAQEYLESALMRRRQKLETRLIILGTLGNNAVYIGLFGTVLGVIKAFRDLGAASGTGPEVVMQGLSEALIATAVGLMVALPSTAAYNFLQKQIKDLCNESESLGRIYLARLKSKVQ